MEKAFFDYSLCQRQIEPDKRLSKLDNFTMNKSNVKRSHRLMFTCITAFERYQLQVL